MNEILILIIKHQDPFLKPKKKTDRKSSDRSNEAPLTIQLSNQFHEDLKQLYELQQFSEEVESG